MNTYNSIYCGDCTECMSRMDDGSIDSIISDPPYAVGFKSNRTTYDDSPTLLNETIPLWLSEFYRILKQGSWMFLFTGVKNINRWIDIAEDVGFTFKNMLATRSFCRGGAVPNNFVFELQPVLVFTKGEKGRKLNKVDFFPTSKEWLNDKRNKNKTKFSYSYSNWIPSKIAYGTEIFGHVEEKDVWHPNAKSEKLCRFLVELATNPGEVVFDPFLGCGTTGAAAVSVGRNFLGCEQDKKWADVAQRRISNSIGLL